MFCTKVRPVRCRCVLEVGNPVESFGRATQTEGKPIMFLLPQGSRVREPLHPRYGQD